MNKPLIKSLLYAYLHNFDWPVLARPSPVCGVFRTVLSHEQVESGVLAFILATTLENIEEVHRFYRLSPTNFS